MLRTAPCCQGQVRRRPLEALRRLKKAEEGRRTRHCFNVWCTRRLRAVHVPAPITTAADRLPPAGDPRLHDGEVPPEWAEEARQHSAGLAGMPSLPAGGAERYAHRWLAGRRRSSRAGITQGFNQTAAGLRRRVGRLPARPAQLSSPVAHALPPRPPQPQAPAQRPGPRRQHRPAGSPRARCARRAQPGALRHQPVLLPPDHHAGRPAVPDLPVGAARLRGAGALRAQLLRGLPEPPPGSTADQRAAAGVPPAVRGGGQQRLLAPLLRPRLPSPACRAVLHGVARAARGAALHCPRPCAGATFVLTAGPRRLHSQVCPP